MPWLAGALDPGTQLAVAAVPVTDTLYADVSEWQRRVDDSYPYRVTPSGPTMAHTARRLREALMSCPAPPFNAIREMDNHGCGAGGDFRRPGRC